VAGNFILAAVLLLAGFLALYFGRILLIRGIVEKAWLRIVFGGLASLVGLAIFVLGFVAFFTALAL
jgi:hypothetical protein